MGLILTLALALIITLIVRRGDKQRVMRSGGVITSGEVTSSGVQCLGAQLHLLGGGVKNGGEVVNSESKLRECCATCASSAGYG